MKELLEFIAKPSEYYIEITNKFIKVYNNQLEILKVIDKKKIIEALNNPIIKVLMK